MAKHEARHRGLMLGREAASEPLYDQDDILNQDEQRKVGPAMLQTWCLP